MKYIIDLPERYIEKRSDGDEWLQMPVNVSGHELTIETVIPLTPYTEPDTEQVREEAFKNGYDAACKDIDVKSKINAAYRKGLEDAWDAARKIVLSREDGGLFGYEERKAVFGCGNYMALKTFLAPEAIEKIRQYEQEQKQLHVGDEVNAPFGKAIVVNIDSVAEKIWLVYADGHGGFEYFKDAPTKTGRHFPEIAEVLRKMQEKES